MRIRYENLWTLMKQNKLRKHDLARAACISSSLYALQKEQLRTELPWTTCFDFALFSITL